MATVVKAPSVPVAPLVGAWIEMGISGRMISSPSEVAPLVGAWIEITDAAASARAAASLLSWERGLK